MMQERDRTGDATTEPHNLTNTDLWIKGLRAQIKKTSEEIGHKMVSVQNLKVEDFFIYTDFFVHFLMTCPASVRLDY